MAEHIKCRGCLSPDCRGCNIYTLAAALERRHFDSLMDENRAIHINLNVREIKSGEWVGVSPMVDTLQCSECGYNIIDEVFATPFCPVCGAEMR